MRGNAGGFEQLLSRKEIVICCGPGGVGKTTTAAALGAIAAQQLDASVLVITVDPARRLADALGLSGIGNEATPVPSERLAAGRRRPRGQLAVAMLDAAESWDALVRRYAASPAAAEEILANPLYRNVTTRFARSHEYIAMERLYELSTSGAYDLLVVDTPPSQGAIDFLDAPDRMAEFFSSRLLRWLTAPLRSRLVELAARPFTQLADRILGTQFLEDLGRFFLQLQGMYAGFVDRSSAVGALLREPKTTFVLVTTPEDAPVAETSRFVDALRSRRLDLGMIVANKVLPAQLREPGAIRVADELAQRPGELAAALARAGAPDEARVAAVLGEIGASFANFRTLANRQRELLDELARRHSVGVEVPHLQRDVTDVAALLEVGELLFAST